MATIINADTSDGLKLTSDTSGQLELQSAGSTKVTMDATGNVGIGTASPQGALEVVGGAAAGSGFSQTRSSHPSYAITCGGTDTVYHGIKASGALNWYTYFEVQDDGTDISALKFRTGPGTERMRIDSSGNVLVGCTTAPSASVAGVSLSSPTSAAPRISVGANTGLYTALGFTNGNGNVGAINTTGSSTQYATSSDYRLKENIVPMTGALARVSLLKPVTYSWKSDGITGEGFIAHELQEVIPDCVSGEKDAVDAEGNPKYQGVDTSFLVATLTAAIQEQQAIIETLTTRVEALEAK